MGADTGIMNIVLHAFLDKISVGIGVVSFNARGLLGILATMELILVALWWAYSGSEALSRMLRKVLTIFFFIWVIDNYSWIIGWVTDGFVWTGHKASGGAAVDIDDPSGIFSTSFTVVEPILLRARSISGILGGGLIDALISCISALVILLAYFLLALQVFLTRIEFALISTLGLILVPFGVFKYTAFMAEKVFGAVISFGVKLMVLAFIISVGFPIMQSLTLPPDPSWPEMFSVMFGSLAMALLGIHAPGIAAGLLSGGPSLTAGAAAGTALAATGVGAAGVLGTVGAARAGVGASRLAYGATVGATKAGASSLGGASALVSAGRSGGQNGAGVSGKVGKYSSTAGTLVGTAGAVGKAAVNSTTNLVTARATKIKDGLANSYAKGRDRVTRTISPGKTSETTGSTFEGLKPNRTTSKQSKVVPYRRANYSKGAAAMHMANSGSQSTHPSQGVQANLKDDEKND